MPSSLEGLEQVPFPRQVPLPAKQVHEVARPHHVPVDEAGASPVRMFGEPGTRTSDLPQDIGHRGRTDVNHMGDGAHVPTGTVALIDFNHLLYHGLCDPPFSGASGPDRPSNPSPVRGSVNPPGGAEGPRRGSVEAFFFPLLAIDLERGFVRMAFFLDDASDAGSRACRWMIRRATRFTSCKWSRSLRKLAACCSRRAWRASIR